MTEDMSTRPRPRLRAARLTLGRWCALQAVRRMAVAPEPTGASAEGSSPAPLLCDVLSPFGYPEVRQKKGLHGATGMRALYHTMKRVCAHHGRERVEFETEDEAAAGRPCFSSTECQRLVGDFY